MLSEVFTNWILPTLRVSTPLVFAALGGLWCERSGVIQIGLEGYMMVGAFFSAVVTLSTSNPWLGLLAGAGAGLGLSLLYGVTVLKLRANQIVSGTAFNLFAMGVPPFLSMIWFDSTGSTPVIPGEALFRNAPLFLLLVVTALSAWVYHHSRFGLRIRFAGEHPKALESAGVSVAWKRWQGIGLSGLLAGIAGASLSVYLSSSYTRNMSAGRGFIALAAVILGKWRPLPTVFACLLFGVTEQLQIRLQGVVLWGEKPVPVQWIQILPYLITLIVLAFAVGRSNAPKGLGATE
jgi:ABC-type uncharacterized transport system permease subunit